MKYPLLVFSILILLGACQDHRDPQSGQSGSPPNILVLFTDDQTFNSIRALGNPDIHTPNLDRLVRKGTSFTHAFNMGGWHGAICMASRAMMISGASLWRSREFARNWAEKDSLALTQTWGRILAREGYLTYISGKWHVAAPPETVFDTVRNIRPGMPPDAWRAFRSGPGKALAEKGWTDVDLKAVMPVGYHRPNDSLDRSWLPTDSSRGGFWLGGKHWSEVVRDDAIDFLADAARTQDPFFMYLAFNAPHDPRQSPQEFLDLYPLDSLSLPANWLPENPFKDPIGCSPGLRDEALAPFPRTPYAVKKHIQEYYAIISHLDAQIGEILDALEASGKAENTVVFFTADHGLAVGQHGFLGKQNLFDHSIRLPLIMAGPGVPEGKQVDAPVYLQDIMPTSLELAGIQKPTHIEFNSLMDLATGTREVSTYEAIYGAYRDLQRMIRKGDHKLIVYPDIHKVMLFDLKEDPWEMNDLMASQDYANKAERLFKDLQALQAQFQDTLDLSGTYGSVFGSGL